MFHHQYRGVRALLAGIPRYLVWLALLVEAGLALAMFVLLQSGGDDGATFQGPTIPSMPRVTTTPTAAPGVTDGATPAVGSPRFRVAAWADADARWQFGGLYDEASGYHEGQAITFLLRIDEALSGTVYAVSLYYDCRVDQTAAFDFLSGYESDRGSRPILAEEGPGQVFPDATIPVPDDPTITFDDEEREADPRFGLWGATFDSAPAGPAPDGACRGRKRVDLAVRALAPTVYLLWGGHLASSADWGEGQGAAGPGSPFEMRVRIRGLAPEAGGLAVAPGAVSP